MTQDNTVRHLDSGNGTALWLPPLPASQEREETTAESPFDRPDTAKPQRIQRNASASKALVPAVRQSSRQQQRSANQGDGESWAASG
ncbi:hypothetical protein E4U46_004101 [Claviceps purpurea]|nr:hypothetical protein E4U46_004101 [Claviceps purpurea]